VDDVSVDAVSPCVVELVAGLAEDAVDAVGDVGVVVVEGPIIVHENSYHFRPNLQYCARHIHPQGSGLISKEMLTRETKGYHYY